MMSTTPAEEGFDGASFALLAAVSAAVARPLETLDPARCSLGVLSAPEVKAVAAHPAFRGPLNRAVLRAAGVEGIAFDRLALRRLGSGSAPRLAALLVTQPLALVEAAALTLGAAALHRRVLRLALKADRQRARSVLTDAGFDLATQEAPILHAGLGELDRGEVPATVFGEGEDPAEARAGIVRFGLALLARFVASVDGGLAQLFVLRLPPPESMDRTALAPADGERIVKLLRRRMPQWSAIIA